jgi:hypothetical protein
MTRNQAKSVAAFRALGRLKQGVMNGTEKAYALHLEARKQSGAVLWYKFEGMKFRLADGTFYTPDFIVLDSSGFMEAHEVKGFWTDDARVKIKVAADLYPLSFIAIKRLPRGGGWDIERF